MRETKRRHWGHAGSIGYLLLLGFVLCLSGCGTDQANHTAEPLVAYPYQTITVWDDSVAMPPPILDDYNASIAAALVAQQIYDESEAARIVGDGHFEYWMVEIGEPNQTVGADTVQCIGTAPILVWIGHDYFLICEQTEQFIPEAPAEARGHGRETFRMITEDNRDLVSEEGSIWVDVSDAYLQPMPRSEYVTLTIGYTGPLKLDEERLGETTLCYVRGKIPG